jgi:hypothetical protein
MTAKRARFRPSAVLFAFPLRLGSTPLELAGAQQDAKTGKSIHLPGGVLNGDGRDPRRSKRLRRPSLVEYDQAILPQRDPDAGPRTQVQRRVAEVGKPLARG